MNNAQPHWIKSLRSMRFMQLLFFSLGTLLVQAVLPRSPWLNMAISLLYLNAMLVALSASGTRPLFRHCLAGLWLLSLVTRFAALSGLEQSLFVISKGIGCILLTVCIGSMAHYMFFRHRVTTDTLFAGIVIYVLIAILFGQLYSVTDTLLPGSFAYPTELAAANSHLPDIGWNYFSFVTIATLD